MTRSLLPSSKRNPCPICGRCSDGDCRIGPELVLCHHGASLGPPELRRGETMQGNDGQTWAFTGFSTDQRCSTFVLHTKKDSPRRGLSSAVSLMPTIKPAPLPSSLQLLRLPEVPAKLTPGSPWWFSETQLAAREGAAKAKPHHWGKDGWTPGAGPDPWPFFGLRFIRPPHAGWLLELEGEKCAAVAMTSHQLAAISQPGHNHATDAVRRRYGELKASGCPGVVYVADHDETGIRKGQKCAEQAAAAGLPFLLLHAADVWPDMPPGGSIDDASGTDVVHLLEQAVSKALTGHLADDDDDALEVVRADLERLIGDGALSLSLAELLPLDLANALAIRAASFPVDEMALLLPLLCSTASIIGNRAEVQVKVGWSEPFVLWAANVASASDMKSPSASVMSKPLGRWQVELNQADSMARDAWQMRRNAAKARGMSKEDLVTWEQDNPPPDPPRQLFVVDATLEAVCRITAGPRYCGLLSYCDELAAWFASLRRGQAAVNQRPNWLSLWSGGVLKVSRATTESTFVANTAHSIFGNLTRSGFAQLLAAGGGDGDQLADQDGMAARFLLLAVENPPWAFNDITSDVSDDLLLIWRRIDRMFAARAENSPAQLFTFDPIARAELMTFCQEIARQSKETSTPDRAQWLGKLRGNSVRIAGVLQALELAAASQDDEAELTITMETVQKTIKLCRYLLGQYDSLHAEEGNGAGVLPSKVAQLAVKGVRWRREQGENVPITLRQLQRWCLPDRDMKSKERKGWLAEVAAAYPQLGQVVTPDGSRQAAWLPSGPPAGESATAWADAIAAGNAGG